MCLWDLRDRIMKPVCRGLVDLLKKKPNDTANIVRLNNSNYLVYQ